MKSFKQFVKEMNDNPDPDAVADQARKAMKAANDPNAPKQVRDFNIRKAEAMRRLNMSRKK